MTPGNAERLTPNTSRAKYKVAALRFFFFRTSSTIKQSNHCFIPSQYQIFNQLIFTSHSNASIPWFSKSLFILAAINCLVHDVPATNIVSGCCLSGHLAVCKKPELSAGIRNGKGMSTMTWKGWSHYAGIYQKDVSHSTAAVMHPVYAGFVIINNIEVLENIY